MKLRLDYETETSDWGDRTELVIYKDGTEWHRGSYGGEPEDNTHYRDYSWVREVIADIATALGAEVERTSTERTEHA